MYDELLSARSFAGTLLDRGGPRRRPELTVTTGWLSSLLAVSATDLGDHAAAVVWCADTERRSRDAGYPELAGWAALTRALIAWYQGDPARSAAAARRGQAGTAPGTVAYVKLAAQEMRCAAMLGDAAGTTAARHRAARTPGDQPTNYARTLLILALAAAGLGDADEAAAAGAAALAAGRIVWPTMVLAGKLDQSLTRTSAGSAPAADFRARYLEAGGRLALTAARTTEGDAGE